MFAKVFAVLTAERLSAALVYLVGSTVGACAAKGLEPLQWAGGITAILGSVLIAVVIRTWPKPARAAIGATGRNRSPN